MSFFRDINKIENGIRRDLLEKEKTEKMGVPVKLGLHDDKTTEGTEEGNKSLLGAMNFYGEAKRSGNLRKEEGFKDPVQAQEEDPQAEQQEEDQSAGQPFEPADENDDKSDYKSEVDYSGTYKEEEEDKFEDCVCSKDVFGSDVDDQIRACLDKDDAEAGDEDPDGPVAGEDEVAPAIDETKEPIAPAAEEAPAAPSAEAEPVAEAPEESPAGEAEEEEEFNDLPEAGSPEEGDGEQLTPETAGLDEETVAASIDAIDIEKASKERVPGSFWMGKHPSEKGQKARTGLMTRTKDGKDVAVKNGTKEAKQYKKLVKDKKVKADGSYTPKAGEGKSKKPKAKAGKESADKPAEDKSKKKGGEVKGPEGLVKPKDVYGESVNVKNFGRATKGRSKRQRRHTGEIWWGKYGVGKNPDQMVAWTKWDDSSIVRVKKGSKEHKTLSDAARAGNLKPGQSFLPEGLTPEQKRHASMSERYIGWRKGKHAEIIKTASSRGKRLTKDSEAEIMRLFKEYGIKFSPEQIKNGMIKRILDEVGGHKMNLGAASKWSRTPAQVRRDFIDGMDASNYDSRKEFESARKRIANMTPDQFEAMMRAVILEDDEDAAALAPGKGGTAKKSFDEQLGDIMKSMSV